MNGEWTVEKIKEGFDQFFKENNRLPTAPEIDKLEYLPLSRQIQRKFGGLEKLRTVLGYEDTHFGKGSYRSDISNRVGSRGRDVELSLEKILREKFQEVFVHTERIFDDSKTRVDFYIYCPSGNFGIDVFYTETMRDLQKNINIKIDKYQTFPDELFLVVANSNFTQKELDQYMLSKTKALPKNTKIINLETLYDVIRVKDNYPNPLI